MNIRLDGKRALVTGGNSGIGEAVVLSLIEAGAKVAINYHGKSDSADALVKKIQDQKGEAIALQADVADPQAVAQMFAAIDKAWGGLDLLINNAGIDGVHALAWQSDLDAWKKVIEVNLYGAYHCAREALKRMTAQKSGVVVNISSVHEEIAWSGYSAYTASKAAVSMLTKTLAQEAAPFGIRVLSVAPGAIRTPINKSVWSDPANMKDLLEKIPLDRIGEPNEIGQMVVLMASKAASYVTGRTVFVDGGMTDYPDFSHGG
jgi:glucose 1-dehydrogenase